MLTNQTDACMGENFLFIVSSHIFVINGFTALAINPTNIKRTTWKSAIEMLDEAHHPHHLDTSFNGELAPHFHLPLSP